MTSGTVLRGYEWHIFDKGVTYNANEYFSPDCSIFGQTGPPHLLFSLLSLGVPSHRLTEGETTDFFEDHWPGIKSPVLKADPWEGLIQSSFVEERALHSSGKAVARKVMRASAKDLEGPPSCVMTRIPDLSTISRRRPAWEEPAKPVAAERKVCELKSLDVSLQAKRNYCQIGIILDLVTCILYF